MLERSPEPGAEEVAIHDYEGFAGYQVSEYASISEVCLIARSIVRHGEAISHWLTYLGGPAENAIDSFDEAYHGHWHSMIEYAEGLVEDVGLTITVDPPSWESYVRFETEALARDLGHEMYEAEATGGGIHIFNPSAAD